MTPQSLGIWREKSPIAFGGQEFRNWSREGDGAAWYRFVKEQAESAEPGSVFVLAVDGKVWMLGGDPTTLVPQDGAELWLLPDGAVVGRGWGVGTAGVEEPAPVPAPDPVTQLTQYLAANPQVAALINSAGNGAPK